MNTKKKQNNSKPNLPLDIRQIFDERNLVLVTLNAVQSLDWTSESLAKQGDDEQRPQMMMTLLAYCYASGRFGSHDVIQGIMSDPQTRYICAHSFPTAEAIRKFRQRNRTALQTVIATLLQQIWAWRLDQAEEDYPGYSWVESVLAVENDRSANNRLEAASLMDEIYFED